MRIQGSNDPFFAAIEGDDEDGLLEEEELLALPL